MKAMSASPESSSCGPVRRSEFSMRRSTPGARRASSGHQPRQQDQLAIIGGGEMEALLGGGRIEALGAGQSGADVAERFADRFRELERARGRLHLGARAHEQRIVEQQAQPGERGAHRRLAEPDPGARASDAALEAERFEAAQQVEIDGS